MEALKDSVVITLKGKEFTIKFPTIGEYIQIESNKQRFADGNYALLAFGNTVSMNRALDIVDSLSYFSVLIGTEFLKIYNVQKSEAILKKFNHASKDGQELLEAYNVFSDFYNSIEKRIDRPTEKKKNDDNIKDSSSGKSKDNA